MRIAKLALLAAAVCAVATPFTTLADDAVWVGLIYATNEESPAPPPRQLVGVAHKLKKIFGYNQFTLLGDQRRIVRNDQSEEWLVPGKPFSLSVQTTEKRLFKTARSDTKPKTKIAPSLGTLSNGAPMVPVITPPSVQEAPAGYRLKLQLFQGEKLLVQTDADLDRKSPAFIRGPLYSKGQLILMLQME